MTLLRMRNCDAQYLSADNLATFYGNVEGASPYIRGNSAVMVPQRPKPASHHPKKNPHHYYTLSPSGNTRFLALRASAVRSKQIPKRARKNINDTVVWRLKKRKAPPKALRGPRLPTASTETENQHNQNAQGELGKHTQTPHGEPAPGKN